MSLQWPPPPPADLSKMLPAEPAVPPEEQAGWHSAPGSGLAGSGFGGAGSGGAGLAGDGPDWAGAVSPQLPVPPGGLTDPVLLGGVSEITAMMAAQLDDGASTEDVMPVIKEATRRWLESQVRAGLLPASAGGRAGPAGPRGARPPVRARAAVGLPA